MPAAQPGTLIQQQQRADGRTHHGWWWWWMERIARHCTQACMAVQGASHCCCRTWLVTPPAAAQRSAAQAAAPTARERGIVVYTRRRPDSPRCHALDAAYPPTQRPAAHDSRLTTVSHSDLYMLAAPATLDLLCPLPAAALGPASAPSTRPLRRLRCAKFRRRRPRQGSK